MRILFRTLGGKSIGFGHYFRCLSLAKAFRSYDQGIEIVFLINDELKEIIEGEGIKYYCNNRMSTDKLIIKKEAPNLIVFDSYEGDDDYLQMLKSETRVALIDDSNNLYDTSICDYIINGNAYANELGYSISSNTKYLLGSKYLILKEEYWDSLIDVGRVEDGILITTGGTDNYSVSYKLLWALKDLDITKRIIVGPGYSMNLIEKLANLKCDKEIIIKPNSLKEYIDSSRYIISACGTTIYEILSRGKWPVIFSIADNQDIGCNYFKEKGIIHCGKYPNIDYDMVARHIKNNMSKKCIKTNKYGLNIDGNGANRIVKEIIDSEMML